MTTVIREGNMVYSDSCWGKSMGSPRVRSYGISKLFINTSKSVLIGFTGSVPESNVCSVMTTELLPMVEMYLKNWLTLDPLFIENYLSGYFKKLKKADKDYDEHFLLIFFTKDCTVWITVRVRDTAKVYLRVYPGTTKVSFGSGSNWYVPNMDKDIPIVEKFQYIYRLDPNSGGDINAFDLNTLKEIP